MFLAYEHRWRSQRCPGESAASMCLASPGLVTVHPDDLEAPRRPQGYHLPRRQRRLGAGKAAADETLIRALARAHRWKRMLEEGKYRSAAEIAEAEGVTRSFVNRLLRLTLLAPDIQQAIIDGGQPKAMQLAELTRAIPDGWEEQREIIN